MWARRIIDESRIWRAWADELGIPQLTFMSVFGAIVARGQGYHDIGLATSRSTTGGPIATRSTAARRLPGRRTSIPTSLPAHRRRCGSAASASPSSATSRPRAGRAAGAGRGGRGHGHERDHGRDEARPRLLPLSLGRCWATPTRAASPTWAIASTTTCCPPRPRACARCGCGAGPGASCPTETPAEAALVVRLARPSWSSASTRPGRLGRRGPRWHGRVRPAGHGHDRVPEPAALGRARAASRGTRSNGRGRRSR